MPIKPKKNEYFDIEKEIDIEWFRDSIFSFFSNIPDPRASHKTIYKLEHLFFIILSAVLAGANSLNQIAVFAQVKSKWIKRFIKINNIPTYGVFWWILVRIKPEFLRQLLGKWLQDLPEELKNQILAIDGKCLRGTKSDNTLNPSLHLVSLFAVESGLVIAQQPVENKSNEITAIPKVLEGLDLRGAVITIDAMGCQKKVAQKICLEGADYVFALKGNAGLVYNEIIQYFKEAEEAGYQYLDHLSFSQQESGHGRIVERTLRYVQDVEWIPQLAEWKNLEGIIEVICQRTEKGKTSFERRYYITSLNTNAERMARIIQSHWSIENHLHRQLDVNFIEDNSSINTGYAAENLALFRRLALNILGPGKGLIKRRKRAAWDEEYLTELIRSFLSNLFN